MMLANSRQWLELKGVCQILEDGLSREFLQELAEEAGISNHEEMLTRPLVLAVANLIGSSPGLEARIEEKLNQLTSEAQEKISKSSPEVVRQEFSPQNYNQKMPPGLVIWTLLQFHHRIECLELIEAWANSMDIQSAIDKQSSADQEGYPLPDEQRVIESEIQAIQSLQEENPEALQADSPAFHAQGLGPINMESDSPLDEKQSPPPPESPQGSPKEDGSEAEDFFQPHEHAEIQRRLEQLQEKIELNEQASKEQKELLNNMAEKLDQMNTGLQDQLQSSLDEMIQPMQGKIRQLEERVENLISRLDALPEHIEEMIHSISQYPPPPEEMEPEESEQKPTAVESAPDQTPLEESIKKLAESFEVEQPLASEDISDKNAMTTAENGAETPQREPEEPSLPAQEEEYPDQQPEFEESTSEIEQDSGEEYISDELEPVFQNETIVIIGGSQNVVPRYEELVNSLGGRFEHYLTVDEFSTASMEDLLDRAYLVVAVGNAALQPGLFRLMAEARRLGRRLYLHHSTAPASLARFLCDLIEKESI